MIRDEASEGFIGEASLQYHYKVNTALMHHMHQYQRQIIAGARFLGGRMKG